MTKRRIVTNIRTKDDIDQYLFEQERKTTERLYKTQGLTAKETAKAMGVTWLEGLEKLFHRRLGPKGAGHGGARPNAGNKKGIQFCQDCGKTQKNCECT